MGKLDCICYNNTDKFMSKNIKVIVSGASGKMGRAVIGLIPSYENIVLTGAIEKKGHPLIDRDISAISPLGTSFMPTRFKLAFKFIMPEVFGPMTRT